MKGNSFGTILKITICLTLTVFTSCVSMSDRQMHLSERDELEIIGQVETSFTQFQPFHVIRRNNILSKAYPLLLEQARLEYGYDVDVRNIRITGGPSRHNVLLMLNPFGYVIGALGGAVLGVVLVNLVTGFDYTGHEYAGLLAGLTVGPFFGPFAFGNFQTLTVSGDVVIPRIREED